MCVSRLKELLRLGYSLRKAFASLAGTMQQARDPSRPFAAFSVARILNDGMVSILGYETPPPLLIGPRQAAASEPNVRRNGGSPGAGVHGYLEPGDAILLTSDGITQAGLGGKLPLGWGTEGLVRFINDRLVEGLMLQEIPEAVHRQACLLWKAAEGAVPVRRDPYRAAPLRRCPPTCWRATTAPC